MKPQDDWQHHVDTINIQLKQLTTEPGSTPSNPEKSEKYNASHEPYYELLRIAPDNYFSNTKQTTPEIQHTTKNHVAIKTSCKDKKQLLLN